jgi:hypothetical protein
MLQAMRSPPSPYRRLGIFPILKARGFASPQLLTRV